MLSRFVFAFLPRSKRLLISWLYSQSAVILKPEIIKFVGFPHKVISIGHKVIRLDAMVFVLLNAEF